MVKTSKFDVFYHKKYISELENQHTGAGECVKVLLGVYRSLIPAVYAGFQ
jgi:hypothetical protein